LPQLKAMEQTFKTRVASLESSCTDAAVATELTASGLAAVLSRLESVEARCAAGRLEALERQAEHLRQLPATLDDLRSELLILAKSLEDERSERRSMVPELERLCAGVVSSMTKSFEDVEKWVSKDLDGERDERRKDVEMLRLEFSSMSQASDALVSASSDVSTVANNTFLDDDCIGGKPDVNSERISKVSSIVGRLRSKLDSQAEERHTSVDQPVPKQAGLLRTPSKLALEGLPSDPGSAKTPMRLRDRSPARQLSPNSPDREGGAYPVVQRHVTGGDESGALFETPMHHPLRRLPQHPCRAQSGSVRHGVSGKQARSLSPVFRRTHLSNTASHQVLPGSADVSFADVQPVGVSGRVVGSALGSATSNAQPVSAFSASCAASGSGAALGAPRTLGSQVQSSSRSGSGVGPFRRLSPSQRSVKLPVDPR